APFAGGQRLLRKAEAIELAEILRGLPRPVARNRLSGNRMVGEIDDLEHRLRHGARVDVGRLTERTKLPRQVAQIGVELDVHRARHVDLRVGNGVRRVDVSQAGHFADLLVERDERVAEAEHRHDDDPELDHERTVVAGYLLSPQIATQRRLRIRRAHLRRCRPIATTRYSSTAPPTTPIETAGLSMKRDRMMPKKNTSAIASRTSPVRRFARFSPSGSRRVGSVAMAAGVACGIASISDECRSYLTIGGVTNE